MCRTTGQRAAVLSRTLDLLRCAHPFSSVCLNQVKFSFSCFIMLLKSLRVLSVVAPASFINSNGMDRINLPKLSFANYCAVHFCIELLH